MLFSSSVFLFIFLPVVLICYFLLEKKFKNVFLLAASIFFYAYGEPRVVIIMICMIIVSYICSSGVRYYIYKNKIYAKMFVVFACIFDIFALCVYKYLNFIIYNINNIFGDVVRQTNILLPIGISFFTFQSISYIIDIYREEKEKLYDNVYVKKQNRCFFSENPINVALYISMFPQLVAGPIVRYETIARELKDRSISWSDFCAGTERFVIGLCKKILLANTLAVAADRAFAQDPASMSILMAWLGMVCYTFQIYFDFSGYSDMAIGLGRMFGFHYDENFNYPYISRTITEFWRRWHISLSTWFRDYVYIPLGGSRVRPVRHIFNLFVVWVLTGIWHGAAYNFIAWGFLYFVLLASEKFIIHPERFRNMLLKAVYMIFAITSVMFLWVIFRSPSLEIGINYIGACFGIFDNVSYDGTSLFLFHENIIVLIIAAFCATPVLSQMINKIKECRYGSVLNGIRYVCMMFLFLCAVSYLVIGAHNPFIYFNF